MRPLLIILGNLFILSNFYFSSARKEIVTLSFTPKSTLIIKGKSNVHQFECDYNTYELSDSLKVNFKKNDNTIVFENTQLLLEKTEFDCGGRGINKDFHKLLQTKDFPHIKVTENKTIVNTRTNRVKKITLNNYSIGLWLTPKKFVLESKLNNLIELIPKQQTPF